jgi:probable addiction module antidote protein
VSVTGKRKPPEALAFDKKHHDAPRAIAKYLNVALSTGDPVLITKAIGDMVRAQGVTKFAQKAGMRRDTLYRTFSGEMSPTLETVMNALMGLDIQLIAKPAANLSSSG